MPGDYLGSLLRTWATSGKSPLGFTLQQHSYACKRLIMQQSDISVMLPIAKLQWFSHMHKSGGIPQTHCQLCIFTVDSAERKSTCGQEHITPDNEGGYPIP